MMRAREHRRLAREGLSRQMIKTLSGRSLDEVGEMYKMGQRAATRSWIGTNQFRPDYVKLERGTAAVALDLLLDDKLDAAVQLLGFRKLAYEIDTEDPAVNEGYRRGFVSQLKDYLSHEGRKT